MNVNLKVLGVGALFFLGGAAVTAQKRDTATKTKDIEEVVVVAFGKQKKEAIVGSVVTVDSKVIEKQQATSVVSALQGTTSGVNIITSGGQPGNNPSIYIRGIGSINASTQPLIIVDGSPYNGNINNIPQDQVESLTVLKDAGSTALYGSRAANGVIVITTKKGRLNTGPQINVTSMVGVGMPAVELHKTLGAEDYMKYSWQALKNSYQYGDQLSAADASLKASNNLISTLGYNPYNVATPIDVNGNVVSGAKLLWDTDWQKYLINRSPFKQEHRFNISGGDSKTTYFLGADYLNMEGAVKTSNFERVGVRLNVESKPKSWLNVGMNGAFTSSYQSNPNQSGSTYTSGIQWIYNVPNIYPLYMRDDKGNLILDGFGQPQYDYGANASAGRTVNAARPLFENENAIGALYNNRNIVKRSNFTINGFAEAFFTKNFSLRSQLSYEQYMVDENSYSHYALGAAQSVKGRVSQTRALGKTLNFWNSLNWNKKIGDHSIGLQGIFEAYQFTYDPLSAQGTGFLPNVYVLNGATTPESVGGYVSQERLARYLGRATYNFRNKYFLEGSFSKDGSSRFSPETRWGSFYSVGGSWVISNEEFLRGNETINNLKLRASYGELGNNQTTSYFPYLTLFNTGWNQLGQTGVLLGSVTDYNLTWETTATTTVGLDFGLFKNRINGSVEYFQRESLDLIYAKPLPGSTGNTSITTNIGSIKNYGWELNLNSINIRKPNFEWTTNFNISTTKNVITELTQKSFQNGTKRWEVGRSLYDFYIPEWAGVDPTTGMGTWYVNELDENGVATGNRITTTDYTLANQESNKRYVGSSLPDFTGGLTNYFRVGSLDLNILFNYSFGSYIYDSIYAGLMSGFSRPGYQQSVDVKNAWQQPGDVSAVPINYQTQNNNNGTSTRFLFKNDYIRLKSLTVGYNVNGNLLESVGVNQLRIFLQGDNLWTWQSHKGIDPEQSVAGTTDNRSYNMKNFSLGVTVRF
ncbi:TonB-linked outer membrane protein, SusC/RagA family [Bergeyella porcorum]|uniref:TonB-linked outer membrane protein, SusC/RagA family n=2 Tax=Bergeyella porcorum TaxID=1735111 RepID=A0AAU0F2Z5_9FLAO